MHTGVYLHRLLPLLCVCVCVCVRARVQAGQAPAQGAEGQAGRGILLDCLLTNNDISIVSFMSIGPDLKGIKDCTLVSTIDHLRRLLPLLCVCVCVCVCVCACRQAKHLRKEQKAKQGEAYARALDGWAAESRKQQKQQNQGAKAQEFDGGEFDAERAWMLNPRAESVFDRLGGDAPFHGIRMA
jgi:hypothetical protein